MTPKDREIQRKLKILKHTEETGHVGRTCRHFGIGRASFYRWKAALEKHGEAALVRKKPIPKNPKNRTPPEIVEKVLHLRKTYHLGPMRIVCYLARYHDIKISGAGVSRILKRNGLNRLPRGTRLRKVHTTRLDFWLMSVSFSVNHGLRASAMGRLFSWRRERRSSALKPRISVSIR